MTDVQATGDSDSAFMAAALACAALGRGHVEPNPMVGAVLVRDGREISRGFHRRFGGHHAEVEAVLAARAAGTDLRGATLYVTLEPCCHTNKKTPPCAPMLAGLGLRRVVVAMEDPDPNVRGRGLAMLRDAGVAITTGVCEAAAKTLLRAYVKLRTQGRPWVICKWAQTADGYLALPPSAGRWISGEASRRDVHRLRGLCDAILVGVGTVLADDPLLNNRSGEGKQPTRIVLDTHLRTPPTSRLVQTAREFPLMIVTQAHNAGETPAPRSTGVPPVSRMGVSPMQPQPISETFLMQADALRNAGVELLELSTDDSFGGKIHLPALLDELGRRRMTYLLVEGGHRVLQRFLHAGLADEMRTYTSPRTLRDEFLSEALATLPHMDTREFPSPGMDLEVSQPLGEDTLRGYARAAATVRSGEDKRKHGEDDGGVTRLTGNELGDGLVFDRLLEEARKYARTNFFDKKVAIESEGVEVLVAMSGIKHTLTAAKTNEDIYAVIALPQLLQRAVKTGESPDKRNRNNVVAVERYRAPLRIGDNTYMAEMIVRVEKKSTRMLGHLRVFHHQELKGL
ncbi:MAG: bifunctional diaminohydroxyphosphoribosylaminopyrimidine deaminase/5-amino-6-(5-phosphoribosylamino)uracil reductase RibD [Phycisphaerae bacterium]|nr:bifunctional diaminohydroxyphosphoribosylaminopyrimidine deaminase/5-amino-6-(5-phosphoribosylamino)uracil reductase RibD [Phycisphaerae bacterium]